MIGFLIAAYEPIQAAIGVDAIGTASAAMIASLTGVAAWRTNQRSKRIEEQQALTDEKADLAKSQVEGWTTLIESLSTQYKEASEEAGELRKRLGQGNKRFDALTEEMRSTQEQHTEDLRRLNHKIVLLCEEIRKLGGDVEAIMRGTD